MADLILHVGPGKCGSSSIQGFFRAADAPCRQRTRFLLLDPAQLARLDRENPNGEVSARFAALLETQLAGCDALILSHEALFKRRAAIESICRLAAGLASTIIIVGYCRRQSDLMVSAYSQWFFRSPERARETTAAVVALGLEPTLFTGLETHLMAAVATDFRTARQLSDHSVLDWHAAYAGIARRTRPLGAAVQVGQLPRTGSGVSLIRDFCARCGLTPRDVAGPTDGQVANVSFHPDLVEAVDAAVRLGLKMPGPHDRNEAIAALGAALPPKEGYADGFLSDLKAYADGCFLASNAALCRDFGLPLSYFAPTRQLSKPGIMDAMRREQAARLNEPARMVETYRRLAARLAELLLRQ